MTLGSSCQPSAVCGVGTGLVAGDAGSVMIERLNIATVDSVRITLNVQFSDGTVWTDKIFTTPYR